MHWMQCRVIVVIPMSQTNLRSYSELITIDSFTGRFDYLKLNGVVGVSTFGFDRYLNQRFYKSQEWVSIRNHILIRDGGYDLGIEDRLVGGKIIVHHMNPLLIEDIILLKPIAIDPEYLISMSINTHNAIHYGDENLLIKEFKERTPDDTKLW